MCRRHLRVQVDPAFLSRAYQGSVSLIATLAKLNVLALYFVESHLKDPEGLLGTASPNPTFCSSLEGGLFGSPENLHIESERKLGMYKSSQLVLKIYRAKPTISVGIRGFNLTETMGRLGILFSDFPALKETTGCPAMAVDGAHGKNVVYELVRSVGAILSEYYFPFCSYDS